MKTTPKQKILKYLQLKDNWIFKMTKLRYCYKKDFEEVENWGKKECRKVWKILSYFSKLNSQEIHFPNEFCPWCLMDFNCETNCGWWKRHNKCLGWVKIWDKLKKQIIKEEEIFSIFKEMIKKVDLEG